MNYGLALIALLLRYQNMPAVMRLGIHEGMLSPEAALYFGYLKQHYETHGQLPSASFFQGIYPQFKCEVPTDSIEAVCEEIKTRHLAKTLSSNLSEVAKTLASDPWEARKRLLEMAERITGVGRGPSDLVAGDDAEGVVAMLQRLQLGQGLLGYPWPWQHLSDQSIGICPTHFLYFYGREKSRKTFLLLYLTLWFNSLGLRVLFCNREMTNAETAIRLYSMKQGIPYKDFTKGKLTQEEIAQLQNAMASMKKDRRIFFTEVTDGFPGLISKIDEYKPHIVIHDHLHSLAADMMAGARTGGMAAEHAYIGRAAYQMKELAKQRNLVIIAAGHAGRAGEASAGTTTSEMAGSDRIVRSVDYNARVISNDKDNVMALIFNACRHMPNMASITIDATLGKGFGNLLATNADWVVEHQKKKAEAGAGQPLKSALAFPVFQPQPQPASNSGA